MRDQAFQVSMSTIGEKEYWNVYKAMNDSVKVWAENQLWLYKYFNRDSIDNGVEYQIDSLLCFNKERNMCFTGILRQISDSKSDDIGHFFGIKINNQWYFFGGATLILFRENFQKETDTPLSFERLKELAMKHIFRSYLHRSKNGDWEINEAFFESYYKYDAYNLPVTTQAARDSSWIELCRENWKRKNKR